MKNFLLPLILLFAFTQVNAQAEQIDLIVTKTNKEMKVKILNSHEDYIYFIEIDDPDQEKQSIAKSDVKEVVYGHEMTENEDNVSITGDGLNQNVYADEIITYDSYQLQEEEMDEKIYDNHRVNLIKINLTSLANGSTMISYERAIDRNRSFEITASAHGFNLVENNPDKNGLGIEAGYKVKLGNIFSDYHYPDHVLSGTYLKGTIGFGSVNEFIRNFYPSTFYFEDKNRNYGYIGADLGYQWMFGNLISMELYTGMHYYNGEFRNLINDNGDQLTRTDKRDFEDGDIFANNNIAIKAGFKVGFAFGYNRNKKLFNE